MVSLNNKIYVVGFISVHITLYVYTFSKILNVFSASSAASQQDNFSTLPRSFNIRSSDSAPYSPCHYPVHEAPRYSIRDETLTACIASLKASATELATKWPRDAISTMNDKGSIFLYKLISLS